jgi:hypothetical protein
MAVGPGPTIELIKIRERHGLGYRGCATERASGRRITMGAVDQFHEVLPRAVEAFDQFDGSEYPRDSNSRRCAPT